MAAGGKVSSITLSPPNKNDIPMFLAKLWNLVEDPQTDNLIHWNTAGNSFIVHDPATFSKQLLPQYFKHRNMASFIRVLNMYGFRKVVKLESGSLKSVKDEMEFQHPCFVRGHEQLLLLIKRKMTSAPTQARNMGALSTLTADGDHSDAQTAKVLEEIRVLRANQDTLQTQFDDMKRENESVWAELIEVRSKHAHQQVVVSKLIEFFVTLLRSAGTTANPVLRAPAPHLAIKNAAVNGENNSAKRARLEENVEPANYNGPVIRDVTDELSGYGQQDSDGVDWDVLLSSVSDPDFAQIGGTEILPDNSTYVDMESSARNGPSNMNPSRNPTGNNRSIPNTPQSLDALIDSLRSPPTSGKNRPRTAVTRNGPGAPFIQQPYSSASATTRAESSPVGAPMEIQKSVSSSSNGVVANADVAGALAALYLAQSNAASNGPLSSEQVQQQVNSVQLSLDSIRQLLASPQSKFNLDLGQVVQLFQADGTPVTAQAVPLGRSQPNNSYATPSGSSGPGNQLVEYNPHSFVNLEDNFLLGMDDQDNDEFMKVFDNLPNPTDDGMIEGVTIQIPEYPSNPSDLATWNIPLPLDNAVDEPIQEMTFSSPVSGGSRQKRKATNPLKL